MLLTIALLLAANGGYSETDVALQSSLGKQLCVNPDAGAKTCSSILSYKPGVGGFLVETGELLIAPAQGMTLELSSSVKEEGGALCGAIQAADLQKGIVRVRGMPLSAERNSAVLAMLTDRMAPVIGKKACEVLIVREGQLQKVGQVDGLDLKLPGKPVKWVDPTEDYRVASSASPG